MRLSRKAALLLGALALLAASSAQAEIGQSGDLRVVTHVEIQPFSLPRAWPDQAKARRSQARVWHAEARRRPIWGGGVAGGLTGA